MIKRLLQQVKNSRKLLGASVVFGCLGGLVLIAEAYYIASIVDDVFLQGFGFPEVKLLLALLLGVIVFRGLIQIASEYTSSKLAQDIKAELRLRLIDKLEKLGPQYEKSEKSGELVATVYEGVEQLENYLAKYVPQIALSMFIPFAIFIVVLGEDLFSALVYGVTLPLLIVFMILIGKYTKHRTDKQYKLLGRLGGHFQEILRGMETLKMFNRSRDQYDNIALISEEHRKSTMATLRLAFLSAFVMELFATISTAIVAVFLGLRLIEGEMQFLDAFLILLLTPEFYAPIRALGTQFHSGMNGASAATRIFQILDEEEKGIVENPEAIKLTMDGSSREDIAVAFENVVLQHDGYEVATLQSLSFNLKAGQKLALVGRTGAGKTTVLELIQGFIKPTSGQISINGINLAELSMENWRDQIAVVSQHTHLFHGTVKENLVGFNNNTISDVDIWRALEWTGAQTFISMLPNGLNTILTDQIQLSGGQIQRLALSRAFLRQDAKLVLIDEATTGLDVYHEQLIKTRLSQFLENRTAIIIAHQLEFIEEADHVIVLKEGEIIEQGAPDELANQQGVFNSMLEAGKRLSSQNKVNVLNADSEKRDIPDQNNNSFLTECIADNDLNEAISAPKEQAMTLKNMLKTYKQLIVFFMKHKYLVALAIMLSFFTVAANIGLMGTSGYLIAKSALRPENILMVYIPVIGVRFFGISRAVFRYLERLASHNVTFKTLHDLRLWLYSKIEPKGMTVLRDIRGGTILASVISSIEQLQYFFLRIFSPVIVYVLTVVGSVIFMQFIHPQLALALLVMLLVAGIAIPYRYVRKMKQTGEETVQLRSNLYEQTLDMIRGISTLQQCGWFKMTKEQIAQTQQKLNKLQLKELWYAAYHNGLMTLTTQIAMWIVLIISIPLVQSGSVAPYMLPAIVLITLACFEGAAPLPQAFQASVPVAVSARQLFSYEGKEASRPLQQLKVDEIVDRERTQKPWRCELREVSFKYEGSERLALKNINLLLETGKRVAIVGESGAGKSSLVQALMKLRPISSGEYRINEQLCHDWDDERVRTHFSVVSQHVQLFNATVLDNLRLGNREASLDEVRAAAKMAEIDEFIMTLPKGYNCMIGEYGATLSGGQRQRLALARAIIQGHAALLFDEPATGLDTLTEQAFMLNIKQIEHKHAVLWITHRLQQIVTMDEIIVMDKGQIIERGTHEQLLALRGLYSRMWAIERATDWQSVVV